MAAKKAAKKKPAKKKTAAKRRATPTPASAAPVKAPTKPVKKKSRYKTVIAQKLFEPVPREVDDELIYIFQCNCGGKSRQFFGTKTLYRKALNNGWHKLTRHEFVMGIRVDDDILEYIEPKELKNFFSSRGGEPNSDQAALVGETSSNVQYLIISVRNPELAEVRIKPANMSQDSVDEIREYLQENPAPQSQDIILDRWFVADVRQSGDLIYIDPTEL